MTPATADLSTALEEVVTGADRPARVVASFPGSVYLRVDAPVEVLALVAPTAIALPYAAILRWPAAPPTLGDADACARVGHGRIVLGELTVRPRRWWSPVPRMGRLAADELAAGIATVDRLVPVWPDQSSAAAAALSRDHHRLACALAPDAASGLVAGDAPHEPDGLAEVTRRLVGLGAGLTPAGDDLLSATIAALGLLGGALGAPGAVATGRRLAAAAEPWRHRTTAVSAALLAQAARGAVAVPVAAVLRALAGRGDAPAATARLLATGHTSGHDLAAGLLLGARLTLAHHAAVPAA